MPRKNDAGEAFFTPAQAGVRIACLAAFPVKLPARSKRVNVMLDETLLRLIDARTGNRSAFLAEAAREKLQRERA